MTRDWAGDDSTLLAALDDALSAARSVPPDFVATGRACFAWHGVDAELARLTHDSAGLGEPVAVRAESATVRAITFRASHLAIELEIGEDVLHGQLVPSRTGVIEDGVVEVQLRNGEKSTVTADAQGYFSIEHVPATSFRLYCRTADTAVLTPWVSL